MGHGALGSGHSAFVCAYVRTYLTILDSIEYGW